MAERHDDIRFEPRDVNVGQVVWLLIGLSAALAVAMLGLWFTQSLYVQPQTAQQQQLPPEPRIEGIGLDQATHSVTNSDLPTSARSQRIREDEMLLRGWADAASKRHPPIAEAMKRIVERERR